MPTVEQQISAVLGAAVPFFVALFAILAPLCVFIWRAMEWRYKGIIDIKQAMLDQAAHQHQIAVENESALRATLADQKKDIEEARKKDPANTLILHVSEAADTAKIQLDNISTANSAVSHTLIAAGITNPSPVLETPTLKENAPPTKRRRHRDGSGTPYAK